MTSPLRFGILGAARIAPGGLVQPAAAIDGVDVVAVAARDIDRARGFAATHHIPEVSPSYAHLCERADIDAVYIALPASAHLEWGAYALRSGKHVLCEKPCTATAVEAEKLVSIGIEHDRLMVEAFHYRYHPYMHRLMELAGDVGEIESIESVHHNMVPRHPDWSVYWDASLAGGATLHLGCYSVHCMRTLLGEEPDVVGASANWVDGVDTSLEAELGFPSGAVGRLSTSITHAAGFENFVRLKGTRGEVRATNFVVPHLGEYVPTAQATIEIALVGQDPAVETAHGPSTYQLQLEAFARAVEGGETMPTSGADTVANMAVIDALFAAAR